jgi:hypothetical protein
MQNDWNGISVRVCTWGTCKYRVTREIYLWDIASRYKPESNAGDSRCVAQPHRREPVTSSAAVCLALEPLAVMSRDSSCTASSSWLLQHVNASQLSWHIHWLQLSTCPSSSCSLLYFGISETGHEIVLYVAIRRVCFKWPREKLFLKNVKFPLII